MEPLSSLAIVTLAGLIHASFQLSVSMLTLLSSHTIGGRTAYRKLMRRASSFTLGVIVMTLLLLTFVIYCLQSTVGVIVPPLLWSIGCGLSFGLAIGVWAFYYRRSAGTTLWLPRGAAIFLMRRTKATKSSTEAFSLGLTSVIAELLFIIAPLFIAAMTMTQLVTAWQALAIALYVLIASLPLIIVYVLIGSGHKLSRIQKWREANKRFLQFAAGSGLFVLALYVFVEHVLAFSIFEAGGLL